ncbi:hypothetical protein ATK74_0800 [Propionicimonas paludicola]|uniref:Phage r1t holin n=1 Tax=Propionicimonas paludicola TaxID=185243 RepID=A0A2A9CQ48_9ACTN|nr:hypothetical protein [Propionicimonas paludicola]PFG16266.1 hypothetical protein ATK74_0800 [Propionicimonas paludicola]
MSRLFTVAFWRLVAGALARTAIAALVPAFPALLADPAGVWRTTALTVGFTVVGALASAFAGLPTTDGGPWWSVALQRGVRQFGQYVAAATASGVLLSDFDWPTILIAAVGSAGSTIFLAALALAPSLSDPAVVELAGKRYTGVLPVPEDDDVEDVTPDAAADVPDEPFPDPGPDVPESTDDETAVEADAAD